jgi:endonuclease/exonuclease/phosphatase family metal-dependent hydrolase
MSYNALNYPGSTATERNPYFSTVISNANPDILVMQEMTSQTGVNGFLSNVLIPINSNYTAGTFLDGPDTDNAIFFKSNLFTLISNTAIPTTLRDINEFKLVYNATSDTLRIYSVHLKASSGSTNEQQRLAEVTVLRNVTDALPSNKNYIVCGDFNIYGSTEPAYQKLLNQSTSGYFIDLFNLTGTWDNATYAQYHTQSPRTRSFDGGSTGGMNDRFDLILMSPAIINSGGITYVPASYTPYGNDSLHYNDSINRPPNNAVGQVIADAIHYASDHIPVFANFSFETSATQQINLTALIEGFYNGISMIRDTVTVQLRTITSPYSLVDQTKIYLSNSGTGIGNFSNAVNGTPYYLVIKHRNGIETWSAASQIFSSSSLTYDFTTASNKAYGNNLKLINGKWCIKAGDVNQDGFVNSADLNFVYSNNVSGFIGYNSTDLNGDNFTEIADLTLVFTNYILGVQKIIPLLISY